MRRVATQLKTSSLQEQSDAAICAAFENSMNCRVALLLAITKNYCIVSGPLRSRMPASGKIPKRRATS
jgi:hypothetical protein